MKKKNFFAGPQSLSDFLDPAHHLTPLVELPPHLNPLHDHKVRIYLKMQNFLPLMNVKSLAAHSMLTRHPCTQTEASSRHSLIESSSGNTAFSLTVLGRLLGYRKTRAIVSTEAGMDKLRYLLLAGAEVEVNREPICPSPQDPTSGINKAVRKARQRGWINVNQYTNASNPQAHELATGPQIFFQLGGDVQIFCAGMGTTGTMVGTASYLKRRLPSLYRLGVVRKPNNPIPGPRTRGLLRMIEFDWQSNCDGITAVSTRDAFATSLRLVRHGLLAGPSTGMAVAGLIRHLGKLATTNRLASLANPQGEIHAVVICCDTPFLYLDEYFSVLPRRDFPRILNEDLLPDKIRFGQTKAPAYSVSCARVYKSSFLLSRSIAWQTLRQGGTPPLAADIELIDLRPVDAFADAHIPGSRNLDEASLIEQTDKWCAEWENKKVFFICSYGEVSLHVARLYRAAGIEAYSLAEGFVRWSDLNYPRYSGACRMAA